MNPTPPTPTVLAALQELVNYVDAINDYHILQPDEAGYSEVARAREAIAKATECSLAETEETR